MNYYEHHLGDYAEATLHLSFIEDAAYSRLIRKYYSTEKPLPADIKSVQRIVGARTKEEKNAGAAVLQEFFSLEGDGWHNQRCDAEIEKYLSGEPERELKKANEDNRLKRHREERARLFKALTDAGLHASWNIGMTELREMVKRLGDDKPATPETFQAQKPATPETPPATAPATPATATQTPVPRHQTPVVNPKPKKTTSTTDTSPPVQPPKSSSSESAKAGKGEKPLTWLVSEWEQARGKSAKSFVGGSEQTKAWQAAGVTESKLRQAYDLAVAQREADNDPAPLNPKFLDLFVARVMNPKEQPGSSVTVRAWHESAKGIEEKGRELGVSPPDPLTGGFPAFKARVFEAAGLTAEA